ncbi:MAG: hypothetical protein ACYSW7_08730 [Planctomycetota bacterium]|jgi:hypothetical protein
MKRKDIWISVAIIAVACLAFCFHSQQKGYIRIDGPSAELQLGSGLFSTTKLTSGPKPVALRARAYRPKRLSIEMKENNNTWRIDSRGPWGELSRVKVKNDETTVLKPGPPLLIKPKISQRSSLVSVDFSIIGQAGEHYGNSIMKNNRRVSAPKLKIVDETGEVLASGIFSYG